MDRRDYKETRPDTRPSVADGRAGAEMRVFPLFDSMVTDGRTDKASYRVACPQLKRAARNCDSEICYFATSDFTFASLAMKS